MPLPSKNLSKINPLRAKNWRGIERTTRTFFKSGKQDSAKILAKEFQKARINRERRGLGQEIVQKMINEGRITENKARSLMSELGYTGSANERFRNFKSTSEYKSAQKKLERVQKIEKEAAKTENKQQQTIKNKVNKDNLEKNDISPNVSNFLPSAAKMPQNTVATPKKTLTEQKRPTNLWEILNKKQHSDIFHEENQES